MVPTESRVLLPAALRVLLANTREIVFVKDAALRYVAASRAYAELLGRAEPEALVGRSDGQLLPAETARKLTELDRRALERGSPAGESQPAGAGGPRVLVTRYRLTDARGAPMGLCGLGRDTAETELAEKNRRLEESAALDELTGLLNRKTAVERIRKCLAEGGESHALLFIDLDGFKAVNDTLGHPFGDRVLRETAARLRETFRWGDVVGRVGGDEFIVLLRGVRCCADILRRAGRVFDILPRVESPGGCARISCSIGVSMCREGKSFEQLYAEADKAMYAAKARGHNRIEFHRD